YARPEPVEGRARARGSTSSPRAMTTLTAPLPTTTTRADAPGSHDLPRELRLPDLVLTQILFIVGLPRVGVAANQGPAHVVFWLLAAAFFYVPSAIVVIHLNRLMPLEGGLYQWAKLGF